MGLTACAIAYDPQGYWWAITPDQGSLDSRNAMASFDKGDLSLAEEQANNALERDHRDPYAMLTLAAIYRQTGRPGLARRYYRSLISFNPQDPVAVKTNGIQQWYTVGALARIQLAEMDNAVLPGNTNVISPSISPATPLAPMAPPISVEPPSPLPPPSHESQSDNADDLAVVQRFLTLRQLLDAGLITRDEYDQRRTANLGALLPYSTAALPARDLKRPAPPPNQVMDRLRSLAEAFQKKAITAEDQSAERVTVLDALLPLAVRQPENPPPPITSRSQAAQMLDRLEKIRARSLITESEANHERMAISSAADSHEAAMAAPLTPPPSAAAVLSGPGIALGTYGSEEKALDEWTTLQGKFPEQLKNLQTKISKVERRHKPASYHLAAGPLASRTEATKLCQAIRPQHPCSATVIR